MILTHLVWPEQTNRPEKEYSYSVLSWWKGQEEVLIFSADLISSSSLAEVCKEVLGTWVMGKGKRKHVPSMISLEHLYNESFWCWEMTTFISSSDYFLHFLDGLSLNCENKHLKFQLTFYKVRCLFRRPLISMFYHF